LTNGYGVRADGNIAFSATGGGVINTVGGVATATGGGALHCVTSFNSDFVTVLNASCG
jgi:hypothetical protein